MAKPNYTLGEEIVNAVSHGVGAGLAVAALVLLIVSAAFSGHALYVVCACIYGSTLVLMYVFSTLYHSLTNKRAKAVFRVLDHASIFLLIAGTYTPYALISLIDNGGIVIGAIIWSAAILGIVLNAVNLEKFSIFCHICYVVMGWFIIFRMGALMHAVAPGGIIFLVLGGVVYTLGIIFFAMPRLRYIYYYDLLTENVDYEKRCDYICNLLAENGIGKGILLDLACGTGSLSVLLSQRGFDVIGTDASEDMLTKAQEKKYELAPDAIFLCQKMEELDLFGTINAAVCTLDSINHVTEEEKVKEIFRRVSLFMEDGGIFIFDVNTPYKHRKILADNTFVYDLDEVYCVWQNNTDEKLLTTVSLDIFEYDGESDSYIRYGEEFSERGYDLDLLIDFAEKFKFEIIGIYDEMTKEPLKEDSQRAVFVLKKHGTQ